MMTGVTGGNLAVQGWLDVALFHPVDGIVFDCISAKKNNINQFCPIMFLAKDEEIFCSSEGEVSGQPGSHGYV
jgi:hypothetical protein